MAGPNWWQQVCNRSNPEKKSGRSWKGVDFNWLSSKVSWTLQQQLLLLHLLLLATYLLLQYMCSHTEGPHAFASIIQAAGCLVNIVGGNVVAKILCICWAYPLHASQPPCPCKERWRCAARIDNGRWVLNGYFFPTGPLPPNMCSKQFDTRSIELGRVLDNVNGGWLNITRVYSLAPKFAIWKGP